MVDIPLAGRVLAAYQFVAQHLGEPVAIADIRLHLHDVGDCGPETLYPLLRGLHGTVVSFWAPEGADAGTGFSACERQRLAPLSAS